MDKILAPLELACYGRRTSEMWSTFVTCKPNILPTRVLIFPICSLSAIHPRGYKASSPLCCSLGPNTSVFSRTRGLCIHYNPLVLQHSQRLPPPRCMRQYVHVLSGFQFKRSFLHPKFPLAKAMFLCFPSQQSVSKVVFYLSGPQEPCLPCSLLNSQYLGTVYLVGAW